MNDVSAIRKLLEEYSAAIRNKSQFKKSSKELRQVITQLVFLESNLMSLIPNQMNTAINDILELTVQYHDYNPRYEADLKEKFLNRKIVLLPKPCKNYPYDKSGSH